jgi:hypothetical protein
MTAAGQLERPVGPCLRRHILPDAIGWPFALSRDVDVRPPDIATIRFAPLSADGTAFVQRAERA